MRTLLGIGIVLVVAHMAYRKIKEKNAAALSELMAKAEKAEDKLEQVVEESIDKWNS